MTHCLAISNISDILSSVINILGIVWKGHLVADSAGASRIKFSSVHNHIVIKKSCDFLQFCKGINPCKAEDLGVERDDSRHKAKTATVALLKVFSK